VIKESRTAGLSPLGMSIHEKTVNWINMVQDKKYQRGVVKTVLNVSFRKMGGVNFVTCWKTISYSKKSLLCVAS
jgi:hypothetical protein